MNPSRSKIFFASDLHAGAPNPEKSLEREKKFIAWLDHIKPEAREIYLLGDMFDFWFEYRTVVPRGYTRLLGKLAEMADSGVTLHYFTGNHDMWVFDYLHREIGMTLHKTPLVKEIHGKKYMIAHGDGLGPGDKGYKFLKRVFSNRLSQWLFGFLHPNLGIGLALYFSRKSRENFPKAKKFDGIENEWLYQYCLEKLRTEHIDRFVFAHRHIPLEVEIPGSKSPSGYQSEYYNTGDWVQHFSYLELPEDHPPVLRYFNFANP